MNYQNHLGIVALSTSSRSGQKPCSRLVSKGIDCGGLLCRPLLECITVEKLHTLSATFKENSRSVDQMTTVLMCRSLPPPGCVILEGVHWLQGLVVGFNGGAAFHVTHR